MRRFTLLLLAAAVAAACGGGGESTTTTAAPTSTSAAAITTTTSPEPEETTTTGAPTGDIVDVFAEDFAFNPSAVTISVGDAVRWNLTSGSHTTTSGSGSPDGNWDEVISQEAPVVVTFEEAGEFPFYCRFHGDFMSGRVVVEP